jgi:hypothetical protein
VQLGSSFPTCHSPIIGCFRKKIVVVIFGLWKFLGCYKEERRRVAAYREERERKLEHARRAKAATEENPDAQRKGKQPRCTQ